jgi:Flp pilus assembly pilin Flp
MNHLLRKLWRDDEGQDIAEYAVMLAVILVLVVGTIRLVGSNANTVFSNVASSIQWTARNSSFLGAKDKEMYVPFLLFVIVIVLVLIFWELSKINGRLKKALVPSHDITNDDKDTQPWKSMAKSRK